MADNGEHGDEREHEAFKLDSFSVDQRIQTGQSHGAAEDSAGYVIRTAVAVTEVLIAV
ncbi:hypothetical protein [Glaciibacter psychrotolerans]|uniref:Uncharacterized protein n=1 Tax=Glaciibacter psychrotolerans TaxID=670054 RepID=A0A7Z0J6N0_9MICO|nr:hypothetical protein [Leifsonia psychrotolerans]NYJ20104.1 hypothetical protein [Leifsonia psychrotolerans]